MTETEARLIAEYLQRVERAQCEARRKRPPPFRDARGLWVRAPEPHASCETPVRLTDRGPTTEV